MSADRVGGPQRKRTRHGFLDIREAICGLSHSVILMVLREVREWRNKGKAVKKQ